jgi:hypothetical protein
MTDTNRRHLLATTATALATTTGLAGCIGGTDRPSTIALKIDTEDTWEGHFKHSSATKPISGRGTDRYEWTDELPGQLHVSLSKGPQADIPLTATILADDEPMTDATTTEPYDRIQLNYTI